MKKLSIFAAGLVALLGATSCSSEDPASNIDSSNEANVSISLQLPSGLASRTYGDGTTATSLSYAVYDVTESEAGTEVYKEDDNVTFAGLKTEKSFKLVNGRTYTFVFWADCGSTSPYTFDGKNIKVDYENVAGNDENRDAFFAVEANVKVTGNFAKEVQLKRPFAQINLGSDDLKEKVVTDLYGTNCENLRTKLTVKVPSNLNLMDGSVDEQSAWTEVAFAEAALPTGEAFPVEHPEENASYDYISMNYLLMPTSKATVDVKYEISNASNSAAAPKELVITNVPVQRNYRTNIFGSLLTVEGLFNIVIKPDFEDESHNVPMLAIQAEDFTSTTLDPDMAYKVIGEVDEEGNPTTTINITPENQKTYQAAAFEFENVVIDATAPVLLNAENVSFDNVKITGVKEGDENPTVKIDNVETVAINNVTIDREKSYNGFEIGLNSKTTAKDITVTNLKWSNASHNAVCVYSMEDGSTITIEDSEFDCSKGGVPLRLSNTSYAKNVTVNLKNIKVIGWTNGNKNRCDDVIVWIQDHHTFRKASDDNKLTEGNYFETLNPFGTFTINLENITYDNQKVTDTNEVWTKTFTGNTAKIAGMAVNNIGSKSVDETNWKAEEHVITKDNAIVLPGCGMDLVTNAEFLPTVNIK